MSPYSLPMMMMMIPSDVFVQNPFTSSDAGTGFTPWDDSSCSDLYSVVVQSPKLTTASASSPSPSPGSSNQNHDEDPSPDSTEPIGTVVVIDERKRRRMLSNRESARRSRMRKQRHLENLRSQANRLIIENREISNRIRFLLYSFHRLRTDNDRLRSEHSLLRKKLRDIRQILALQQFQQYMPAWPCNNNNGSNYITSEQPPSLIT